MRDLILDPPTWNHYRNALKQGLLQFRKWDQKKKCQPCFGLMRHWSHVWVLLLYGNELSEGVQVLYCDNDPQNNRVNKQKNTALLKVVIFQDCWLISRRSQSLCTAVLGAAEVVYAALTQENGLSRKYSGNEHYINIYHRYCSFLSLPSLCFSTFLSQS